MVNREENGQHTQTLIASVAISWSQSNLTGKSTHLLYYGIRGGKTTAPANRGQKDDD